MKMTNLQKRIKEAIKNKADKYGLMGTETVSIEMTLTDEEKREFFEIDWSENHFWEIDSNTLNITFKENNEIEQQI